MRFIIISLICLSLLTIGCTKDQAKNLDQERTPIGDEQGVPPADTEINIDQARTPAGNKQHTPSADTAMDDAVKHYNAFAALGATDPESAIAELSKYVELRFGAHPLADKWLKLVYRFTRDKKGTFRDMQRYTEWYLQMLEDIDPEKRIEHDTKTIENLQKGLKQLEVMGKMLERQGENLDTYEMPGKF